MPRGIPDLPFTPAALLLTRVVSHPAARPALPRPGSQGRRRRPGRPARAGCSISTMPGRSCHSEEHLVVETAQAERDPDRNPAPGNTHPRLPHRRLHRRAYVIEDGKLVGQWEVTARDRVLGV